MAKITLISRIIEHQKQHSDVVTKRRAVSDIIVTLLMLAITVIGAVLVFSFFQDSGIQDQIGGLSGSSEEEVKPSIKIIGHDTRNGNNLMNISGLNNDAGASGVLTKGSDMITLHIRNTGTGEFPIERMSINEIVHRLDTSNAGDDISSSQPTEGTFNLLTVTGETILGDTVIYPGQEVRLVVKLSDDLPDNIKLNQELRVVVFPVVGKEVFNIIPSGSVG